ncbi:MAG: putative glycosyltransferase [Cyanobacteria bacterium RYN_339]|nr:putative glycosyltransferase [Cyanobacteria bacterium RYN_339]
MHLFPLLPALLFVPACLNAMLNAATFRRLPPRPIACARERVSILVPARNEAERIGPLLDSFLALDDRLDLELIVYDDDSSDEMGAIVEGYAARDPRVRLLHGNGPPPGWTGRTNGLHTLAGAAQGDWLLFTDADVTFEPGGVERAVAVMQADKLDMLTLYPRQILGTWAERAFVPLMVYAFYCFGPQWIHRRGGKVPIKPLNGQFNLWSRASYDGVGGYAAIKDAWLDDMTMGRRLAALDRSLCYRAGAGVANCRMYRGFGEVWRGFAKHTFDAYGLPPAGYFALQAYQAVTHVALLGLPWMLSTPEDRAIALAWVAMIALTRLVACLQCNGGWTSALLDPFALAASIVNACESYRQFVRPSAAWKGRIRVKATPPA